MLTACRATRLLMLTLLVCALACGAWSDAEPAEAADADREPAEAGEGPEGDQARLERERARHFRELAHERPGARGYVISIAGDGAGQFRRIPPGPEMVPAEMHVVGDYVYVARGWMLYQYLAADDLQLQAQVDLRAEEERGGEAGPGEALSRPDPAMVPVHLQFSAEGDFIYALRGYLLRQFSVDGLEQMAEFDLRTEEELNRPRPEVRWAPPRIEVREGDR